MRTLPDRRKGRLPQQETAPARMRSDSGPFSLRWGALRVSWASQSASFWILSFYLFLEYVRPQSIYRSLDVLPWSQWAILSTLVLFVFEGKLPRFKGVADVLVAIFTAIILASSFFAYHPDSAFGQLELWLSWVVVYVLITNIVTTEERVLLFTLGFLLWNLKMSQHAMRSWAAIGFGYRSWGATGAPGWFRNSGEFGIEMTIYLPIALFFALALRDRIGRAKFLALLALAASAALGTIASSSRGAMLGAGAVGAWMVARSRYRFRAAVAGAVIAAAFVALIPAESKSRFSQMGDDPDSVRRLTYWRDGLEIMRKHPWLGIGYGNWMDYYSLTYFADVQSAGTAQGALFRQAQVPHNPFIQAGAELGVPGLLTFIGLIVATFVINRRTRRMMVWLGDEGRFMAHLATGLDGALVGFLTSGFFVTVLYYPYFWINLAMTVAVHRAAQAKLDSTMVRIQTP